MPVSPADIQRLTQPSGEQAFSPLDYVADPERAPSKTEVAIESAKLGFLEPASAIAGAVGLYTEAEQQWMDDKIEESRNKIEYNNFTGEATQYGLTALRFAPETALTLAMPMSAYGSVFASGGARLGLGGAVGSAEGVAYHWGRESQKHRIDRARITRDKFATDEAHEHALSEFDDSVAGQYIAFAAVSGITSNILGQGYRGYRRGAGSPMKDITTESTLNAMYQNAYKPMSNAASNAINVMNRSKLAVAGISAGGMLYQENAEAAPFFKSLWKVGAKSTSEIDSIAVKNLNELGDANVAARQTEVDITPTLTDYQNVTAQNGDLIGGFAEAIGFEIGRAFKGGKTIDAVDDIIARGNLNEKNVPLETESAIRRIVDDAFPEDIPENIEIREAMGRAFRGGANSTEIKAMMRGEKILEDNANANLMSFNKKGMLENEAQIIKLDKAVDDIVKNIDNKTVKMPAGKNAKVVAEKLGFNEGQAQHIDDLIKSRYYSQMPDSQKSLIGKAFETEPRATEAMFDFRNELNTKTDVLIKGGRLKQADADFAYTSSHYKGIDPDTEVVSMTPKELADVQRVQGVSKVLNRMTGNKNLRIVEPPKKDPGTGEYIRNEQGKIDVTLTRRQDTLQGPVVSPIDRARTRTDNRLSQRVPQSMHSGTPTRLSGTIRLNGRVVDLGSVTKQEFDARVANARVKGLKVDTKDANGQDTVFVTHEAQPLTPTEQAGLGISHDIGDVAGMTAASVQRNLGREATYSRIHSEYSSTISNENKGFLLGNETVDPKHLFIKLDRDAVTDTQVLQHVANNYLRIDDPIMKRKLGVDYVLKRHAFELMGYEKMYMTTGKYSVGRFAENMYRDMVQTFRTSVVLKNPVSLVNNVTSMAFTNFAHRYLSTGRMEGDAFTGLSRSYKTYKQFVDNRAAFMEMKANGASSTALDAFKKQNFEGNPAYELYKRGGLQSLLDDGLADRSVRVSKEGLTEFEYNVRSVFLAEGTYAGGAVRKMHDTGDITNRINMFDGLVKGGMDYDAAAKEVSNMAVNYSRLLHPSLNMTRELGITPFATWFTRFMPQFAHLIYNNPVRAAQLQGMYLIMQGSMGSEDAYGNNYIAGVNVQNWWAFNTFAPDSALDIFNDPRDIPSSLTPQHLSVLSEAGTRPSRLIGITTQQ